MRTAKLRKKKELNLLGTEFMMLVWNSQYPKGKLDPVWNCAAIFCPHMKGISIFFYS